MGNSAFSPLKVWRNVYVKGYKRFPYQKLTGRMTLLYSGEIKCGFKSKPDEFQSGIDFWFGCDCDFPKYKNLKRIL